MEDFPEAKRRKTEDNPFEKLPLELVSEILSYFKRKQDLDLLSLVCKQWFQAIESDHGLNVSSNVILKYERIPKNETLESTFRKFTKLKVTSEGEGDLNRLKKIMSSLELSHLEISSFKTKDISIILDLVRNTLISVTLNHCSPEDGCDSSVNIINFKQLKKVNIVGENSYEFAGSFTNLTCLDILLRTEEKLSVLKSLIAASQNTLQSLSIDGVFKTNSKTEVEILRKLTVLKTFHIKSWTSNCEGILKNLPSTLEVVKLCLVEIPEIIMETLHERLPNLRTLELLKIRNESFKVFRIPASRFLKTFSIASSVNLPNLENIQSNENLVSLAIYQEVTVATLEILVQKFPNLEHLPNIEISRGSLPEALMVISKWTNLKTLKLLRWYNNYIQGDKKISFPKLQKLTLIGYGVVKYFLKNASIPNVVEVHLEIYGTFFKESPRGALSKLPSALDEVRVFRIYINLEDTIEFIKNIRSRNFIGQLFLKDESKCKGEVETQERWNQIIGQIATIFNLPSKAELSFERKLLNEYEVQNSGKCHFKTDLITLNVVFSQ